MLNRDWVIKCARNQGIWIFSHATTVLPWPSPFAKACGLRLSNQPPARRRRRVGVKCPAFQRLESLIGRVEGGVGGAAAAACGGSVPPPLQQGARGRASAALPSRRAPGGLQQSRAAGAVGGPGGGTAQRRLRRLAVAAAIGAAAEATRELSRGPAGCSGLEQPLSAARHSRGSGGPRRSACW